MDQKEEVQTLSMQESSVLKQIMPKTKINHAILHENVSQERHLQLKLAGLRLRRSNALNTLDISRRNFLEQQARKRAKWKLQDESRVSGMTLPHINPEFSRRPSMMTIYKSPMYQDEEIPKEARDLTLLPFMNLRRERTEIIHHHDNIFLTRLPTVVEVDSFKLKRYNTFCAPEKLRMGEPLRDKRFRNMLKSLSTKKTKKNTKGSEESGVNVTRSAPVVTDQRSAASSADYQPPARIKTPLESRVIIPVRLSVFKNDGRTHGERLKSLQLDASGNGVNIGTRSVKSGDTKSQRCHLMNGELKREATMLKREQIQADIKQKDLKQLKKSYGPLRKSTQKQTRKDSIHSDYNPT